MVLGKIMGGCYAMGLACWLSAQTAPGPNPPQAADGLTLHIDVNLVQVDAVVTDRKGHPVTNLKPEDFEILEESAM